MIASLDYRIEADSGSIDDIERGSSFIGNTIFETLTSIPPTATALEFGFAACAASPGVIPSSGVSVQCFEFVTVSNIGASTEGGTTVGYSGVLFPIYTFPETTFNPTTENPIGPTSVTPSPLNPSSTTVPITPTTSSGSREIRQRDFPVSILLVSLNFLAVFSCI